MVDYERVPITDEKSPKEQDFDILVSSFVNSRSYVIKLSSNYICPNYSINYQRDDTSLQGQFGIFTYLWMTLKLM